jgi:hypothetical protein
MIDLDTINKSGEAFNELTSFIANKMVEHKVNTLSYPSRQEDSRENIIWKEISEKLFNIYDYCKVQRLHSWWKHDTNSFNKKIADNLKSLQSKHKTDGYSNNCKINIMLKEWLDYISKRTISIDRPRLSATAYREFFKDILQSKTNFKCNSIRETSNWFAFDKSNCYVHVFPFSNLCLF